MTQPTRSIYHFVRSRLGSGTLLLPYLRAKHRALLKESTRSDSHTYTSFYRSPVQLAALVGPVLDHLRGRGIADISINVFAGSNGAEAYTIASELMHRRHDLSFTIKASDLHATMIDKAASATYSMGEITQGLSVPDEFVSRTFDKVGHRYVVKAPIRSRVSFQQADLLDSQLDRQFAPADIVVAQNVLFHMPPEVARRAFDNIVRFLKPGSVLFVDGMELDMRVELTKRAALKPLDFRVKEIYEYSRRHIPENWWDFYYGNEPYYRFSSDRLRRYCTIFMKDDATAARAAHG
jgi:chemotaxis protein methyltransferase CheR